MDGCCFNFGGFEKLKLNWGMVGRDVGEVRIILKEFEFFKQVGVYNLGFMDF